MEKKDIMVPKRRGPNKKFKRESQERMGLKVKSGTRGRKKDRFRKTISQEKEEKLDNRIEQILGRSGTLIDQSQAMPQVNVVDNQVALNGPALAAVSWAWATYAVSKNVLVNNTSIVGEFDLVVGTHWFMALTVFYDLWLATKDVKTIIANAPLSYWELRSGLTPKVIQTNNGGYSYTFVSADAFDQFLVESFGIPGVFPLQINETSLAWVISFVGQLYNVVTTSPVIDEATIKMGGPNTCQVIWSEMETLGLFKMIVEPDSTEFTESSAAFCAAYDFSTPQNMHWTLFCHEVKLFGYEQWLATLGLGMTILDDSVRRGPHTFSEFMGPFPYCHRILRNVTGREPRQVIRFKNVYLEDFLASILTTLVIADILESDAMGATAPNTISQTQTTVLFSLSGLQFLLAMLQALFKAFAYAGWVGFANATNDSEYICATGTLQVPTQEVLSMAFPNYFNEMRASMIPLINEKKGSMFCTYVNLVCMGKTRGNIYENTLLGTLDALSSLLEVIYPSMTISLYSFGPSIGSVIQVFDPSDFTHSWIVGDDINAAIAALSAVFNLLQGNLTVSTIQGNFHSEITIVYYTKLCFLPLPVLDKMRKMRIRECEQAKEDQEILTSAPFSPFSGVQLVEITNRVPFIPDCVSHDLMNILPITFTSLLTYQPIYNETSGLEFNGSLSVAQQTIITVSGYAHKVSGEGTEPEISQLSKMAQHRGGGFVNFMKTLGRSFLPLLGEVLGEN